MTRHQIDWGIIGWALFITAVAATITTVIIIATTSSDTCTSRGGREVFQYFVPAGKGILVPIYTCEQP